jgi:hypothetical protein
VSGAAKIERRQVPANLVEATPGNNGLSQWLLASPLLLLLGWTWLDLFVHFSPLPWFWVDALLGMAVYALLIVLPLGWLAHRFVTTFPRLFQKAGWDVQPLEPVREAEQYMVHYVPQQRQRAAHTWARAWLRAAQGWVYLEIAAILGAGLFLVPLFFSALDAGFGQ